jgi:hypothetical protein
VQRNVDRHLRDEGAANFSNARARDVILQSDGPDIGVAGAQEESYKGIYEAHKNGTLDQDTASEQMGQHFGNGERTSTTGESYSDDYGKSYRDQWDKTYPNVPPGGTAPP